jgi:DNA (cytosine-5)-methyltransferase 1
MLRAIREIQPTWVVGENVLGLVNWNGGLVFNEVQADLEAEGYEVQPYVLPAVSVNAPHIRQRVWFVAYSDRNSRGSAESNINEEGQHIQCRSSRFSVQRTTSDTSSNGLYHESTQRHNSIRQNNQQSRTQRERTAEGFGNEWSSSDTNSGRLEGTIEVGRDCEYAIRKDGIDAQTRNAPDTTSKGSWQQPSEDRGWEDRRFDNDGEVQYATNTYGIRLRRESDRTGESGFLSQKSEIGNWSNFPTVSPIYTRNDGFSDRLDFTAISEAKWRNESIKASGNAIVPQVVLQIFKAIEEYNDSIPDQSKAVISQ